MTMKTKPRLSSKYANCGAIPAKEYKPGAMNPAAEPLPSKSAVKVRPLQQFRQDRAGNQKPTGTSLGWRTGRTSRWGAGSDNRR